MWIEGLNARARVQRACRRPRLDEPAPDEACQASLYAPTLQLHRYEDVGLATYSIRKLIDNILDGVIRVPAFQRGFVWKPEAVAFLMDSLYRDFPIGSLLLWQTREKLEKEKSLGPFLLPAPKKDWPIQYVLDGQQRITSIFSVFQTEISLDSSSKYDWLDIYFDLDTAGEEWDSSFLALEPSAVDAARHFPLKLIFDDKKFFPYLKSLSELHQERAIGLQSRFKEIQIPYELVERDQHEEIALIFERINRTGVRLDAFQLLSAWTWSTEFDLKDSLSELQDEIEPFGFGEFADDTNLFMKCCAAIIEDDAQLKTIISLKGPVVRARYDEVKTGITGAIDFVRRELHLPSLDAVPYPAMLVPLSRFFAKAGGTAFHPSGLQTQRLKEWFWRANFSRRYSSGVGRAHTSDIQGMIMLRSKESHELLTSAFLDVDFFQLNKFSVGSVNTKVMIAMMAQKMPRSLVNGHAVNLDNVLQVLNRKEFHHIYPKKHLLGKGESEDRINALSNFCFISSGDNKKIGGRAPSAYNSMIPSADRTKILQSNLIPDDFRDDDFDKFRDNRAAMLSDLSKTLSG